MQGMLKARVASRISANCGTSSSGGSLRFALYSGKMSLRNDTREVSKITAKRRVPASVISFASILEKPNTALTGTPSGLVIGGRP